MTLAKRFSAQLREVIAKRVALMDAKRTRPLTADEQRWLDANWHHELLNALPHEERRVLERVDTDLPCQMSTAQSAVGGRVRNLSLGGALIESASGFASWGDAIYLEVDLGQGRTPVVLASSVVRVQPFEGGCRYAVRFTRIEPEQVDELGQVIVALGTQP